MGKMSVFRFAPKFIDPPPPKSTPPQFGPFLLRGSAAHIFVLWGGTGARVVYVRMWTSRIDLPLRGMVCAQCGVILQGRGSVCYACLQTHKMLLRSAEISRN